MTREEAEALVRQRFKDVDGCGSCGFKSLLYEHEPIEVDDEDLANGYVWFPCFSDENAESSDHRGFRIYFSDQLFETPP